MKPAFKERLIENVFLYIAMAMMIVTVVCTIDAVFEYFDEFFTQ